MEKTDKMRELEDKLGKDIDEIVQDILDSMKMLELKVKEEEARIRNYIPPSYQFMIAIVILGLLFLHYGGYI